MAAPTVKFVQFSSSGVDPAGSRHLQNHSSFVKELSTTSTGVLDFGTINNDIKRYSPTKAVLFRVSAFNGSSKIEDMKIWLPERPEPIGTLTYNMKIMSAYQSGINLTDASGQIPTSLPVSQNLFRTNGSDTLEGVGDSDVSQWVFLNVGVDVDVTTGKYGNNSSMRYRCTYNYL